VSDFDETYGSSVHARMAAHVGEGGHEPVDDLDRAGVKGEPPVPGAQWDELHQRWERWDADTETWVLVAGVGDGVAPADENPLGSTLARGLLAADELEADSERVPDVPRVPEPPTRPPGAQWNEIVGRWDRWDEAAGAWVPATSDPEPD